MQFLTLDFQGKIFQTIVPVYFLDEIILTLKHIKTRSLFFCWMLMKIRFIKTTTLATTYPTHNNVLIRSFMATSQKFI
jgi:hypothetical protein